MKQIEIPDILDVLSVHFKIQKPEAFKILKSIFAQPDTTTLFGIFFELRKYNVKPDTIISCTSEFLSVPIDVMKSSLRTKEALEARQSAIYFIKHLTSLSLKNIGGMFNGRDHTTVIHTMQVVDDLLDTDDQYKYKLISLATLLLENYQAA